MRDLIEIARHPETLWRDLIASEQPLLWLLAVIVGTVSAFAAVFFWWAVSAIQLLTFGTTEHGLASAAGGVPWWRVVIVPAAGGLLIGLCLYFFVPERRFWGVHDILEARLLKRARLGRINGIWSILLATVSLGFGMSGGREGPVVHMGATLGSQMARAIGLISVSRRVLVGCGVAAAVSASFNAPIAGVLFAHEVILGHYALSAVAPIVIASAAGTVVSRFMLGDTTVFNVPAFAIQSYWEMPAFGILGVLSAIVAIIFMHSIFLVDNVEQRLKLSVWLRPAVGGLAVGVIAAFVPGVLGVGYETTNLILNQPPGFWMLIALVVAKTAATALTIGSRAGIGVFSPSLFLGIMTGAAFGHVAGGISEYISPELAAPVGLYAIVGMGAVSAAVLGAPISTTLICFELTGNYQVAIFVMVAASISTVISHYFIGGSFFTATLERRGVPVHEGPRQLVLEGVLVRDIVKTNADLPPGISLKEDTPRITPKTPLHTALTLLEQHELEALWIVESEEEDKAIGVVHKSDAYLMLSRALLDAHAEEHK